MGLFLWHILDHGNGEVTTIVLDALQPSAPLREIVARLLALRRSGQLIIQAGDEGSASAPSNIALLKYWGKESIRSGSHADAKAIQIPVSSSLSRNLEGFRSETRVVALCRLRDSISYDQDPAKPPHRFRLDAEPGSSPSLPTDPAMSQSWAVGAKLNRFLNGFFSEWAPEMAVSIESRNNFPTGCGVASSASGYAALVGALTSMAGLERLLPRPELEVWLTEWSRLGSGSATRSAVATRWNPGFVAWERFGGDGPSAGTATATYEVEVHPEVMRWQHLLVVVSDAHKDVGSSEGHLAADHSFLQKLRVAGLSARFRDLVAALKNNDFEVVRRVTEEDAFAMHAVMATGQPAHRFMLPETVSLIADFVRERDKRAWAAMWTVDAGPNIHVLVAPSDFATVQRYLAAQTEHLGLRVLCGDATAPTGTQTPGGLRLGDGLLETTRPQTGGR
jgi:diphosphomevalonate decarboxylase